MKEINATAEIHFTVESGDNLKSEFEMKNDIAEVLSSALDNYLSNNDIEGLEVHFLTVDELSIDDYSEE